MALIQCPECGGKMSDTLDVCPHCGYPLPARTAARRCPECGSEQPDDAQTCSVCGFPLAEPASPAVQQAAPQAAAPAPKQSALTGFLNALTGEKLEKTYITLWEMVKAGTKKYNYEERTEQMDRIFVCGTPDTTPKICDIRTDKIVVWAVWYVLLAFYIATFGMEIGYYILQNRLFIPGMIVYGAFGVPFSCLLLFCEINLFRSIPFYRVLIYFFSGAFLSLFVALIGFALIPQAGAGESFLPALLVGLIEETGKAAVAVFFLIKEKRAKSILEGLLIGAAVGAGFAAFETMGYILINGYLDTGVDMMEEVMSLRAYLAPGGHVAWAALEGAGFMAARGFAQKGTVHHVLTKPFLVPFSISVLLHGIWDFSLIPIAYVQPVLCMIAVWIVVMYYINLGLQQIDKEKQKEAAQQTSTPQNAS